MEPFSLGGLSGHVVVSGNQVSIQGGVLTRVSSTASCPTGKVVVGGGMRTVEAAPLGGWPPVLMDSYPSGTDRWTIRVEGSDDTTVQAYAVCVDGA